MNGMRIGSIAGVQIQIDGSLLIIFTLVAVTLGAGVFPTWHPDWSPLAIWLLALIAAALLLVSVLVHELSHALMGRALGADVRRITLFVFGGMAQVEKEPQRWTAEFWMAIVGPITSLVIGVGCLLLGALLAPEAQVQADDPLRALAALGPVATMLLWLGPINIVLALFNMVPGFPLDGGRVLRALLWGITGDIYRATRWAAALGCGFAWLLIAAGFAMMLGVPVPIFGSGIVGGIWIALIGWFLNNAALNSYREVAERRVLDEVPVARVMVSNFTTVDPQTSVARFIDEYLLASDQRSFPVVQQGKLLGLVGFEDARKVDPAARDERTVADIMAPAKELAAVAPDQAASDALKTVSRRAAALPVVEDGVVRGLLRREDILMWLALNSRLGWRAR